MVKNSKGGKGAKGIARKSVTSSNSSSERLRLAVDVLEQYAVVTKMYGNGMCEIYNNADVKLIGHIRSKFRGRQKGGNMVLPFSIVLIGLREWENPAKNCDILYIYDDNQIEQLKNIPQIKINNILQTRFTNMTNISSKAAGASSGRDDIVFTNDMEEDVSKLILNTNEFKMEKVDEIDMDDI